jgi:hypothetical protein
VAKRLALVRVRRTGIQYRVSKTIMNQNVSSVREYRIEVLDIFGITTASQVGNDSRKINISSPRDRKRKAIRGLSAIRVGNFYLDGNERRRVKQRQQPGRDF